jgi:hypothetical protein
LRRRNAHQATPSVRARYARMIVQSMNAIVIYLSVVAIALLRI